MLRRKYLNKTEEAFYTMCATMILFITGETEDTKNDNMVNRFESAGMLTASSKKNLKSSITYMNKFLKETYDNLDGPTQERLTKRLNKFNLSFVTQYEANIINRDIRKKKEFVPIKRELFEDVIDILGQECVNCKKDYKECKLYDVFDDALMKKDGECINCKYACEL